MTERKLYKRMSDHGNILFYTWPHAREIKDPNDLACYGNHIATFFPELNEWYKKQLSQQEIISAQKVIYQ